MVDDMFMSRRQGKGKPNLFSKLMDEAKKDLHEGCSDFTRPSFIIKRLHNKSYNRITNRAFNQFVELISAAFPHADIPKSYTEAKNILSEVGLGYETIHVCKFDCALFWGQHANKSHCPECGTSRWKDEKGRKKYLTRYLGTFLSSQRFKDIFLSK